MHAAHGGPHDSPGSSQSSRAVMRLAVLGSSSSGNMSMVTVDGAGPRCAWLIDLGFSQRRTRMLLRQKGITPSQVAGVLLTHFDSDHWSPSWGRGVRRLMGPEVPIFVHPRHLEAATASGIDADQLRAIEGEVEIGPGLFVAGALLPHDRLGSCAMRFRHARGASLGFATDLGRATDRFLELMAGVNVLAIESNYCPRMQQASNRPAVVKERIMGGAGHLSNAEASAAVRAIAPGGHVVLLHLSRECNHPALAAAGHHGSSYALTISKAWESTEWIPVREGLTRPPPAPLPSLFEWKEAVR